jgi:hypothetical protein
VSSAQTDRFNPRIALAAAFDPTDWAGTTPFTRSGDTGRVAFPSSMSTYLDPLSFLHGYGSRVVRGYSAFATPQTLAELIAAATGYTNVTATITADDKVSITSDQLLTPTGGLGFGFEGGVTLTGSGPYTATADGEWTRGTVEGFSISYLYLNPGPIAGSVTITRAQSVPTTIRDRNEADADGLASSEFCLEDWDNNAGPNEDARWWIDADGHVACRYAVGAGDITWSSTTFRDRLGFSGDETPITSGGYSILTAEHPLPGFIVPQRPLNRGPLRVREQTGAASRLMSGGTTGLRNMDATAIDIEMTIGGQIGADAGEMTHYLNHVLPYAQPGEQFSVFAYWGDPRRSAESRAATPWSTLVSSELDGIRARWVCHRHPDDDRDRAEDYETDLYIYQRFGHRLAVDP